MSVKVNTAALCNKSGGEKKSEAGWWKEGRVSGLQLKAVTCFPKIAGFLSGPQEKFLFPWNGPGELQGNTDMKRKKQIYISNQQREEDTERERVIQKLDLQMFDTKTAGLSCKKSKRMNHIYNSRQIHHNSHGLFECNHANIPHCYFIWKWKLMILLETQDNKWYSDLSLALQLFMKT